MKKLMLAAAAAASLLTGGAVLTQPAHAAMRCWWAGPVRHCQYVRPYRPYWHPYRHPYWHRW